MTQKLTNKQIERQDFVDNTIYNLLNELIPNEKTIDWNIEYIARVRDTINQIFLEKNICTEQEFYPYLEE